MGWLAMLHWLLVEADWSVVTKNLPLYAVGSFPADQRWRPLLWMTVLITLTLLPSLVRSVAGYDVCCP